MRRLMLTLLAATLAIIGLGTPASAASYTPPSNIPAACQADATAALNNWIKTVPDGSVVDFPSTGCYRLDDFIFLRSRNNLTFDGHGATFKAVNNVANSDVTRARWRVQYGTNITLQNMTLRGISNGVYDPNTEHDHGIFAQGANGLHVINVTGRNLNGDFLEVAEAPNGTTSKNTTMVNVDVAVIGRMGVSCVSCDGFSVDKSKFDKVALHVFDLEIEGNNWPGKNVALTNSTIGTHGWAMFSVGTPFQTTGNDMSNITITGNTLTDPGPTNECRPAVSMVDSRTPVSNVVITGNKFVSHNAAVWLRGVTGGRVQNNTLTHVSPYCGQNVSVYQQSSSGVTVGPNTLSGYPR